MENHIKELLLFVAEPEVPPDNNAAGRSLRPVVISRKISGGTRSAAGTDTKMTLASIFGTWRVQGFNPPHRLPTIAHFPSGLEQLPDFAARGRTRQRPGASSFLRTCLRSLK